MKNRPFKRLSKSFTLLFPAMLLVMTSCSEKDGLFVCDNMLRPVRVNISYANANGTDLYFSSAPAFTLDSLYMYQFVWGRRMPVSFEIVEETPFNYFVVNAFPSDTSTFYVQLAHDLTDTIFVRASRDPGSPCHEYRADSVFQNGNGAYLDRQYHVWRLIK